MKMQLNSEWSAAPHPRVSALETLAMADMDEKST